jgi:hypothetical protein
MTSMETLIYQIIQHDGGWAYRAGETISETFPTHDAARAAADRAAALQVVAGELTEINFEDPAGHWHEELSAGDDRPVVEVKG